MSGESYVTRADVLPLTTAAMVWFRDHYFGAGARDPKVTKDWRASPALAANLAKLPAAYVVTGGYDVLCDEGRAYADQLASAGVAVERAHYPGLFHGFIGMGRIVQAANGAVDGCGRAVKRAL